MGVKKLPRVEKKVEQTSKKKKRNQAAKWNKKMGGRSCFIRSGAFGQGLLRRLHAQTLPTATPPIGKIHTLGKIYVTF